MIAKKILGLLVALSLGGMLVHAETINGIDFVTIGGAGNAADTNVNSNRYGYGAVGYTYRISQKEITFGQYAQSGMGNAVNNQWYWTSGSNGGSNNPVTAVRFVEAAQYCNWLTSGDVNRGAYTISGGQVTAIAGHDGSTMDTLVSTYGHVFVLPTEDEWYKAAYYNTESSSYQLYATVDGLQPTMNFDNRYGNTFGDAPWDAASGTMELNGTYNMMGNAHEFVENTEGGNFVLRGGAWYSTEDYLQPTWRDTSVPITNTESVIGFRIVDIGVVPEPGTISLMSLSTLGLFLTRTIRRRKRVGQSLVPIWREYECDAFCVERTQVVEEESIDLLATLFVILRDGCVGVYTHMAKFYGSLDKAFWNHMVVVHEKRTARRMAFRQAMRKRALDSFDAFLARIMK